MTCETQIGRSVQGPDTMPFSEARCETSELDVRLGVREFLGVTDDMGENFMLVRQKGNNRLWATECHEGKETPLGNIRLQDGESYDVAFGGSVVKVTAVGQNCQKWNFRVEAPDGMVVQIGR